MAPAGSAALAAENRKHNSNDRKCEELGWVCIPCTCGRDLYGCWGAAAVAAFSKLAGRLSTRLNQPKSMQDHLWNIYSRLGLALVRANCRACRKSVIHSLKINIILDIYNNANAWCYMHVMLSV